MARKTYRFRRFAAVAIDWNLSALPAFLLAALLLPLVQKGLPVFLMLPVILSFPVLFLYRDRLFKGRSPGNRLMKLTVLDSRTLQPLTGKALVTRNLFFFLGGLDLFLLLITGSPLGDRVAAALVVSADEIPENPPQRTPISKRRFLKIIAVIFLLFLLLSCLIQLLLNSIKDEPHYALAHSYLLKSEAFAQLDAEPDDVRFTGYSRSTNITNGVAQTEASFTFQIKGHLLVVTCHEDGAGWYVCEECTKFQ